LAIQGDKSDEESDHYASIDDEPSRDLLTSPKLEVLDRSCDDNGDRSRSIQLELANRCQRGADPAQLASMRHHVHARPMLHENVRRELLGCSSRAN
jgi:hypothetical protein